MLKNFIATEHHPSLHRTDSMPFPLAPVSMPHSQNVTVNVNVNVNEENEKDYCYGGYHPVEINEKFGQNNNYRIIRKLGWGHFSTVWLAFDSISLKHVALKIVRSDDNYSQAAKDEIRILEKIKKTNPNHPGYIHLVNLLDSFTHYGPNGEHIVMVFELLGENLLGLLNKFTKSDEENQKVLKITDFTKTYGGLPIAIVKKLTKQLCLAFDYLHRECGLIHTDIKPENILIEIKDVEKFLNYLTLENNEQTERNSRSFHHYQKSPIKCSKPLPSPLISMNTNPFNAKSHTKKNSCCSISRQTSSVTYVSESYSLNQSKSIERISSTSPLMVNVSASEANSDDEYESDDEEADQYFENLDFYKTSTNTTTPPPSAGSRRSTIDTIAQDHQEDVEITQDQLSSLINVKVADLGNACYSSHHFTNDIQTRQYRAPEILLGHEWGCSTDCWSFACLIFELLTGDYLFDPRNGERYNKDEDHIAQILELLEPTNEELSSFLSSSKYTSKYFENDSVSLRSIKSLKYWNLKSVLTQKYKIPASEVLEITEFLSPLLNLDPSKRVDLGGWANHDWLKDVHLDNYKDESILKRDVGSTGEDIKGWSCYSRK